MKINEFKHELNHIKNERIRENAEILINIIPDYFFEIAATSSGKYHPEFARGEGGLVRHTKAVVHYLQTYLNNPIVDNFTNDEKDILILAAIMHDGFKRGNNEKHTVFEHPLLSRDKIIENKDKLTLTEEEFDILTSSIASHMGAWNTSNYSDIILPVPKTKYERVIHLADYFASRKEFNIPFDKNNLIL